jgi:hypothetical protein
MKGKLERETKIRQRQRKKYGRRMRMDRKIKNKQEWHLLGCYAMWIL